MPKAKSSTPHGRRVPPKREQRACAHVGPVPRFVDEVLATLLELLEIYGFDSKGYSLSATRKHWLRVIATIGDSQAAAIKFVKYKLAAFVAVALKQDELPPAPFPAGVVDNPTFLLGGRAQRFIRLLLAGRTAHDPLGVIASILYSKKGMPRPSDETVQASVVKTVETLTTARPEPVQHSLLRGVRWTDVPATDAESDGPLDMLLSKEVIQRELRRTVREIWEGEDAFGLADRMHPIFPSTSANYNRSRSELGGVGELLLNRKLFEGLRSQDGPLRLRVKPREEFIGLNNELEYEVDTTDLETNFGVLYERLLAAALEEAPFVEPVGLAEALKVRVISKGPPLTYYVLKALQKYMWRVLAKHPVFTLTGHPACPEVLAAQLGSVLPADQQWVSADYEAATDNLHSWVSETIAEEIAQVAGLREEERELFVRSLTKHIFIDGSEARPQKTGQLMGSITSFPVLCMANAALCRYAMEHAEGRVLTLRQLPLLVNGDDAAFRTNTFGYRVWQNVTAFAGLKPSVGKVYRSTEFVNINSMFFRFLRDHPIEEVWSMVPFVNMGLLRGLGRSLAGKSLQDDTGQTIGSRSRELWRLTPAELRLSVAARFIRNNRELLDRYNIPWGLPEWIGGLGIAGAAVRDCDLRLARCAVLDRVTPPKAMSLSEWQVRFLAERSLPPSQAVLIDQQQIRRYEKTIGLAAVNLLFTSAADRFDFPERLKREVDRSRAYSLTARNRERFWARRLKEGRLAPREFLEHITLEDTLQADVVSYDEDSDSPEAGFPVWLRTSSSFTTGLPIQEVVSLLDNRQPVSGLVPSIHPDNPEPRGHPLSLGGEA